MYTIKILCATCVNLFNSGRHLEFFGDVNKIKLMYTLFGKFWTIFHFRSQICAHLVEILCRSSCTACRFCIHPVHYVVLSCWFAQDAQGDLIIRYMIYVNVKHASCCEKFVPEIFGDFHFSRLTGCTGFIQDAHEVEHDM